MGIHRQRARRSAFRNQSGVAAALFSSTQRQVLGILFGQPDRSFFVTEIFQRAERGRGAVQRELEKLTTAGLVTVRRIGAQKHYQANPESPVFDELRSIVRKTVGLTDPIRDALKPLARKIEIAFVYGSVARGEERAQSDVDLLIVSDELMLEQAIRRLLPVEKILARRINPTLYTSAEYAKHDRSSFLKKVLAGDRIILIGGNDADS
jgi:predicted nucleotidyltransferase